MESTSDLSCDIIILILFDVQYDIITVIYFE